MWQGSCYRNLPQDQQREMRMWDGMGERRVLRIGGEAGRCWEKDVDFRERWLVCCGGVLLCGGATVRGQDFSPGTASVVLYYPIIIRNTTYRT